MSTNPYGSPAIATEEPTARSQLWPPALLLLICSLLGIIHMMFVAGFFLLEHLLSDTPPSYELAVVSVAKICFASANMFVCALVLAGAISMVRLGPRWAALVGAWAASIPLFGPCHLIAIPFGIWALLVLNKPEVIAAFQNAAANPD